MNACAPRPDKESSDHWNQLLGAVAKQDQTAFMALYMSFDPIIRMIAYRKLGEGAANMADELVQETMLNVWRYARTFDPQKAAANTWINTLARNKLIDMLRSQGRHPDGLDVDEVADALPDDTDLDQILWEEQVATRIHEAMRHLPQEQMDALKLVLEGLSGQEQADLTGLPLGTVKSRCRLGVQKLKKVIEGKPINSLGGRKKRRGRKPCRALKRARMSGDRKYWTGKPCKWGHKDYRYTKGGACCSCARARAKEYQQKDAQPGGSPPGGPGRRQPAVRRTSKTPAAQHGLTLEAVPQPGLRRAPQSISEA